MPPWLWATLIGGTLLGAGVSNLFSVAVHSEHRRPSIAVVPETVVAASAPTSPLSRSIEVTGFRVDLASQKNPEIQYIVVSHSAAKLSGLTVYVTLHAADAKPGQPPLCQFSFVTPDLEPYEAKQMSNTIEGIRKAVVLPDWRELRVDVEVGQ